MSKHPEVTAKACFDAARAVAAAAPEPVELHIRFQLPDPRAKPIKVIDYGRLIPGTMAWKLRYGE